MRRLGVQPATAVRLLQHGRHSPCVPNPLTSPPPTKSPDQSRLANLTHHMHTHTTAHPPYTPVQRRLAHAVQRVLHTGAEHAPLRRPIKGRAEGLPHRSVGSVEGGRQPGVPAAMVLR